MVATHRQPSIPEQLRGRYVDARVVGEGGMGVVFRARDVELDRDVARAPRVCELAPTLPAGAEARAWRLLTSISNFRATHVVRVTVNERLPVLVFGGGRRGGDRAEGAARAGRHGRRAGGDFLTRTTSLSDLEFDDYTPVGGVAVDLPPGALTSGPNRLRLEAFALYWRGIFVPRLRSVHLCPR